MADFSDDDDIMKPQPDTNGAASAAFVPAAAPQTVKSAWMKREAVYAVEHWVAIVSAFVMWGTCVVTALLAYGAVQIPTFLGILAFVFIVFGLYGRRVLRIGSRRSIFFFGVFLYLLLVTLVVLLGLLLINVNRGVEFIEENWYYLQTQVIPFTTELDTKRSIRSNCMWILYFGVVTFALFIPVLVRSWIHAGGMDASASPAYMFPLLLPQFSMAAFVCYFGVSGVELTQFSSPDTSFDLSMSAVASVGHFMVAIVCFIAVLRRPDDPGSYLSGAILASPLALVSIGAGINVMVQQTTVRSFVTNNWHKVLQMLPSQYQQLAKDKYIINCEDAFNFTGWLGLVLGSASLVYVVFSWAVGWHLLRHHHHLGVPIGDDDGLQSIDGRSQGPSDTTFPATPPPKDRGVSLRPTRPDGSPMPPNGGEGSDAMVTVDTRPAATTSTSLLTTASRRLSRRAERATTIKGALRSHYLVERNVCIVTTILCVMAFTGAIVGIGYAAHDHGQCGSVVRNSDAGHRTYSISFPNAQGLQNVQVKHSFPRGTSTVFFNANDNNNTLSIHLEVWGLTDSDVTPANDDLSPLESAVIYRNISGTNGANQEVFVDIHPDTLAKVNAECLSATLYITLPSGLFFTTVNSSTTSALNNLTADVSGVFPVFHTVEMRSMKGGILVHGPTVLDDLVTTSDSGRIKIASIEADSLTAETTDAEVIMINATAVNIGTQELGPVTVNAHGSANVIITDVFAASVAQLNLEDGNMIGVVAGVGVEDRLFINITGHGGIFLDDFVMATGIAAYMTTQDGEMKIAAMTANQLHLKSDSGLISLYEVFCGLNSAFNIDYPKPVLSATTNSASITALGCGATPGANSFANDLDMFFTTQKGDIKVEVNGGGWHGHYECVTNSGDIETSIHGDTAPAKGTVGFGDGFIKLDSHSGDVELAMLPGPLGL